MKTLVASAPFVVEEANRVYCVWGVMRPQNGFERFAFGDYELGCERAPSVILERGFLRIERNPLDELRPSEDYSIRDVHLKGYYSVFYKGSRNDEVTREIFGTTYEELEHLAYVFGAGTTGEYRTHDAVSLGEAGFPRVIRSWQDSHCTVSGAFIPAYVPCVAFQPTGWGHRPRLSLASFYLLLDLLCGYTTYIDSAGKRSHEGTPLFNNMLENGLSLGALEHAVAASRRYGSPVQFNPYPVKALQDFATWQASKRALANTDAPASDIAGGGS